MKKILGLDLGVASIGWSLVEKEDTGKPRRIIGMGSRIIPLSSDDRGQFQQGKAITKNQDRTKMRTQRKGYDRKQLKKNNLKALLSEWKIFPSKEMIALPVIELWKLRHDAASEANKLTAVEFGRLIYMLNQKRGYKSSRSESNFDKKDTDYVAAVKGRHQILKESNLTIGQYFYKELLNAKEQNSYYRIKEQVYPREAYIEEFDSIIKSQHKNHEFLTEKNIDRLRDEIIYYQRKLKSQKGLVNVCEFEGFETKFLDNESQKLKKIFTGPRVAPKTSPLFQLCKIWEVVNNISIKIKNQEDSKFKWLDKYLSLCEKNEIVNYLMVNDNLSFTELIKILKLKKDDIQVNKQIQKGIQGNVTYSEIHKVIGTSENLRFNINTIPVKNKTILDKDSGELSILESDLLEINPQLELEPQYQLWHTIYSIKDLDECRNALVKRFNFEINIADRLSRIDFNKQAFGNKSSKAMRKILPYLMQGFDYSKSCTLVGYNHSNSLTAEEKSIRVTNDFLELLPKNSLRQPVVEKILNQMINVVNAIIDKFGKPDEIRVELARELKQSKDERESSDRNNRDNETLHIEIANRLREQGLPTSKRYIQKYKFIFPSRANKIKEQVVENQCIYCGISFNLSEAISGDNFDVDHIIPKDLLFDDSQTNKVLVHRSCNSTKTNQTAYDYIAKKGEIELNKYITRVDEWFKRGIISYSKMNRLKTSFEEYVERKKHKKETEADKKIWESFINRQLRETQFISRKSKEILQQICNNVTATEGTVTAKLRALWGWDSVLMNLQLPKYKQVGQTVIKEWTSDHGKRIHQKEEIANWSKRDDHRHHAIDALVIACTQQGFIQRMNTLSSSEVKDEMNNAIINSKIVYNEKLTLLERYLVNQKPFTTLEVEREAGKILVSFKAGKKVATNSKYKAEGKNKKTGVIVPRGALHEQFVYGKIRVQDKNKPLKYLFENPDKIFNRQIKKLILTRLEENNNIPKSAHESIKQNPLFLDIQKQIQLESATCFKEEYVIKYKLQDIKAKDVPFIVDEKIKTLIKARLDFHNGKEKEAFKEVLWFNKEKQIPILTVRCFTGLSAVEAIKKDTTGMEIGFAKTGNNHHIAIYIDKDYKPVQHICTLWHAVERKRFNMPYVINNTKEIWNDILSKDLPQTFLAKLPPDNLKLQMSLQQNEMVILGMKSDEFNQAIELKDNEFISKHLYLVWSISDSDFWFRHHLETKNSELKSTVGAKESHRYFRKNVGSLIKENPIKIRINHLGDISKIGE